MSTGLLLTAVLVGWLLAVLFVLMLCAAAAGRVRPARRRDEAARRDPARGILRSASQH